MNETKNETGARLGAGARGLVLALALGGLAATSFARTVPAQREGAPIEHLNVSKKGLALSGYDPVAYFEEGGGEPKEGSKKRTVEFRGVQYRFASDATRDLFLASPERYEPAYGGWCAWAMREGDKVEVDPESFLIEEGRLFVFFDGFFADTRKSWLKKGGKELRPLADRSWAKILGRKDATAKKKVESKLELQFDGVDPSTLGEGRTGRAGLESITTVLGTKQYRFATAENRLTFLRDPEAILKRVKR